MGHDIEFRGRVQITGGAREFVGMTGTVVGTDNTPGQCYRVRLDHAVSVPQRGEVTERVCEMQILQPIPVLVV